MGYLLTDKEIVSLFDNTYRTDKWKNWDREIVKAQARKLLRELDSSCLHRMDINQDVYVAKKHCHLCWEEARVELL